MTPWRPGFQTGYYSLSFCNVELLLNLHSANVFQVDIDDIRGFTLVGFHCNLNYSQTCSVIATKLPILKLHSNGKKRR